MPADTKATAADGGAAAGPSTSQLGTPARGPPASPGATQLDADDGDADAARCAVEVCEVPDDEEADSDADSDSLAGSLEAYLCAPWTRCCYPVFPRRVRVHQERRQQLRLQVADTGNYRLSADFFCFGLALPMAGCYVTRALGTRYDGRSVCIVLCA